MLFFLPSFPPFPGPPLPAGLAQTFAALANGFGPEKQLHLNRSQKLYQNCRSAIAPGSD
jgi:hypothetical protein